MKLPIALFTMVCSSALALAGPDPKIKPPSTGKELAVEAVATTRGAQAKVARELIAKQDCKNRVPTLATALTISGPLLSREEQITGNLLLQQCAKAEQRWNALRQASIFLLGAAPEKSNPQDLVAALVNLGEDKLARAVVKEIAAKFPKLRANLTASVSTLACQQHDYKLCFKATSDMLAIAKAEKVAPGILAASLGRHANSAAALGKYDVYDAAMAELDALKQPLRGIETFKTHVARMRQEKVWIASDEAHELALGTYHYTTNGKLDDAGALIKLRLVNQGAALRTLKVTVEVSGVTEAVTVTIAVKPGEQITKSFSPPLKLDLDVGKVRAARASQLVLRVADAKTSASLLDESLPIQVLPRDHLVLARRVGKDHSRRQLTNSLAWVTPNAKEIDAFLAKAKLRTAKKQFTGKQAETLPQVQALFEELRAQGVTYVMDPNVFDELGATQRTRLPAEVLASTNAQCLEGTLLYATLLEAIGLEPILVYIPGHAFVGWRPSKFDKVKGTFFLETTLTGSKATFINALEYAESEVVEQQKLKNFDRGLAQFLDVAKLRRAGYAPMPY